MSLNSTVLPNRFGNYRINFRGLYNRTNPDGFGIDILMNTYRIGKIFFDYENMTCVLTTFNVPTISTEIKCDKEDTNYEIMFWRLISEMVYQMTSNTDKSYVTYEVCIHDFKRTMMTFNEYLELKNHKSE